MCSIPSRTLSISRIRLLTGCLLFALLSIPSVAAPAQKLSSSPGSQDKAAEDTGRRFLAALTAYREQHYVEAERELASLLSSSPGSFEINELAGLVYVAQGEDEKANRYLAKAVRLKPSVAEARTALGTNLLRLRRPSEAEEQFRKVVDLKPRSYDANHNLGEFYIQAGKIPVAIPFLKRAQELDPTAYNNGYDLALAYEQSGNLEAARQQIQRLIALRDSAELHSLLGEVEERSKNYLASAAQYERAARMEPSEQNILDWGMELLLHHTFELAAEVFKAGLNRFTQSARLQDGLGIALYGEGHFDDAARAFFRASDLDRSDPLPLTFTGQAYDNLSPPVALETRTRLQNFLQTDTNNAAVRYYYAMCLWKINEKEPQPELTGQIESLLKRAVALNPSYGEAYLQLGILHAGQHQYKDAIAEYEQALKASPNLPAIHYRLGQALARSGDATRAKQEFAEFERGRQQEVEEANKQHNQIQQFVYTMRNSSHAEAR